jgi:hypothetical protein
MGNGDLVGQLPAPSHEQEIAFRFMLEGVADPRPAIEEFRRAAAEPIKALTTASKRRWGQFTEEDQEKFILYWDVLTCRPFHEMLFDTPLHQIRLCSALVVERGKKLSLVFGESVDCDQSERKDARKVNNFK